MVSLIKLAKAIVVTALLNKAVRGTLIYALLKPFRRILRLSTVSVIAAIVAALLSQKKGIDKDQPRSSQTLIESVIESMLGRPEKGKGNKEAFTEQEAASAISAILANLLRSMEGLSSEGRQDDKKRVIESKDYKVVYDR